MKAKVVRACLLMSLALLLGIQAKAWMVVGFIHYKHVSGSDYEITMLMIKNRDAPPFPDSIPLIMDKPSTAGPPDITFNIAKVDSNPLPNGLFQYRYQRIITVPGAPDQWVILTKGCCRPPLTNGSGSVDSTYSVMSVMDLSVDSVQASARFDNAPVTFGQKGTTWYWNPGFYDQDYDFFRCRIDTIRNSTGPFGTPSPVWTYPSGGLSVVDSTGEMTWTPDSVGTYGLRLVVEELDSGGSVKGATGYDLYFIIRDVPGNLRTEFINTASWAVNTEGRYEFQVPATDTLTVFVTAQDPDGNQVQALVAGGENLNISVSTSSFSMVPTNDSTSDGTFGWRPDVADQRTAPYFVVFRAEELLPDSSVAFTDLTIVVRVLDSGAISVPTAEEMELLRLWPNPAADRFAVEFRCRETEELSLEILDLSGKVVSSTSPRQMTGHVAILHDVSSLPSGLYIIQLRGREGIRSSAKLVIAR